MTAADPRALVMVTTSFPFGAQGSEAAGSFVADLALALAEIVPVRVVAPGTSTAIEAWKPGVQVFRYAAPSRALSTLRPWRPADLAWLPRVVRGGADATRAAIADGRAAHVLALWGLPSGAWARRAVRGTDLAYSVWLLGSDVWSLGRLPVLRGKLATVLREASHRYADGYELAEEGSRIGRVDVQFLPSTRAIERRREQATRAAAPYRLLFLGRWHPNKGVDLLLDALGQLGDTDWALIESVRIEGGGPLEDQVRTRVSELARLGRPVRAGAYLSKEQAEQAFLEADWALIPSRIESIPVVFSDAMKLRCPVVTMPVGDLPRLVAEHGVGVAAREVSAAAFAQALREALRASSASCATGLAQAASLFDLPGAIVPRLLADAGLAPASRRS